MKKIVAFAGSNSKNSINKKLAAYTAHQVANATVNVLDLNDYDLPLYGIDEELENGIPQAAHDLLNTLHAADGIVLSLAEHNGAYATAFKNAFDWMSRINTKLWNDIPMFLMATSPGGRGGATALEIAKGRFPYMGGNIIADFSLPSFGDNFSEEGIKDETLAKSLKEKIQAFSEAV